MKKILIVEDDSLLNKTLAYNLTSDSCNIASALNFRTAAGMLAETEFDLVLLDIKHPDPAVFEDITGVSQEALQKTLAYLRAHKKRFWVRHVCVPDLTDTPETVRAVRKMAAGAEKIELLPYHTMGVHKWDKLGLNYPLRGVPPLSQSKLDELNAVLNEEGT